MEKANKNIKGTIYVLLSALGFSLIPVLAQLGLSPDVTSATLLFYRFAIAGCIFLIYCLIRKRSIKLSSKEAYINVFIAGVIYSIQCIFFFSSFNHISSSLGEIIFHCYPLFVLITAKVFLNESITLNKVLGVGLSVIGIGIVLYAPWNVAEITGIIYVIISALTSSIYMVYTKKKVVDIDNTVLTMYLCFVCSAVYLIFSLSRHEFVVLNTPELLLNVATLAVFSTVIGFFSFMKGISLLPVGQVSVLSLMEPIFTVIIAYIVLGVNLTWTQLIGTAVLLIAIFIYDRPERQDRLES